MKILGLEILDGVFFFFQILVEIAFTHVYAIDQFFLPDN